MTGIFACGGDDDSFDESNPYVGTWVGENQEESTTDYEKKVVHTIVLTKSGTFSSTERLYVTCKTQDGIDDVKSWYGMNCKINETAEIEDGLRTCEGTYTWDNSRNRATITIEKTSYNSSSTSGYVSFSFNSDYSSAEIHGSINRYNMSNVIYKRQ